MCIRDSLKGRHIKAVNVRSEIALHRLLTVSAPNTCKYNLRLWRNFLRIRLKAEKFFTLVRNQCILAHTADKMCIRDSSVLVAG